MAKNNKLSHDTVLKASDYSIKDETENISWGALPVKSTLDEKQIAYTELLQYFNDYSNANRYGKKNPDEVSVMNYGHRIPLLAASGTGFAIASSKGYGILTFVSDNDKRIYGTLPSEINPSERGSYIFNGKKYYYNPGSSYDLARAENKDGDKDRSEFYYNGKRVKFLPKTTFRYVWNETVRHRNLKRDEALNKLNEFSKELIRFDELAGTIQTDLDKGRSLGDKVDKFKEVAEKVNTSMLTLKSLSADNIEYGKLDEIKQRVQRLETLTKNVVAAVNTSVESKKGTAIDAAFLTINDIDKIARDLAAM